MRVDINRLIWPLAIFAIATLVLFISFPLQIQDEGSVYDYSVKHDIPKTKVNYTAPILTALLAIFVFFWIAMTFTEQELSVSKSINAILNDPACADQLSSHHVYSPFDLLHEGHLGDFPQGTLKVAALLNYYQKAIYLVAISNDNYSITEARQRFTSPIISISQELGHIENAIHMLKPSMRATEQHRIKSVLASLKSKPEYRELYESKAKEELEEEGVDTDGI